MRQVVRADVAISRSDLPRHWLRLFIACALASVAALAVTVAGLGISRAQASGEAVVDAHHHHLAPEVTRTLATYTVPSVTLVRSDGKHVSLPDELGDDRPVVLSFIYTTCTTICPLTSMTLAELQGKLGAGRDRVHLMSISIDPEQDTPARLREYAREFGAGSGWQHYTGTLAASVASQRAFNVYRGDKMSHSPVTLVRQARSDRWVRLEGFATADQLLAELGPLVASR